MAIDFDSDVFVLYATKVSNDPDYQAPGNFQIPPAYANAQNEQRLLTVLEVIRSYMETLETPSEAKLFRECLKHMIRYAFSGGGAEAYPAARTASLAQITALNIFARRQRLGQAPHSYVGPLDIVGGAVVGYSQRALSAAQLGQPLYTIRRDSDDTTQSFSSDATTGAAPVAAISSFVGAGSGFVAAWSDQSVNGLDVVQMTVAFQPEYSLSVIGSFPGLTFSASAQQMLSSTANCPLPNGAYTVFVICNVSMAGGRLPFAGVMDAARNGPNWLAFAAWDGVTDAGRVGFFSQDAGFVNGQDWEPSNSAGFIGVAQVIDAAWNDVAAFVNYNGVARDVRDFCYGTRQPGPQSNPLALGADAANTPLQFYNGTIVELLIYNSLLSDSDRAAIRQNIAAYYGITLA